VSDDAPPALARARRLTSTAEATALYDDWAARYDHDVFEVLGVTGSSRVADLLAERVGDRSVEVVDLGCGTGGVGRRLRELGFDDLTGLDLSRAMLAVARSTGAYRSLAVTDLTDADELGTRTQRFDAAVSAGTFTTGHVTADAVPGILGLLRPGATFVWAIAPALWPDFETALIDRRVAIVSAAAEPIRPGSDDVSHMVVATVPT